MIIYLPDYKRLISELYNAGYIFRNGSYSVAARDNSLKFLSDKTGYKISPGATIWHANISLDEGSEDHTCFMLAWS